MKLRRIIYLAGAFLLVLTKFTIDVIGKNVELEIGGLSVFRELTVIGSALLVYLVAEGTFRRKDPNPVRTIGVLLIMTAIMGVLGTVLSSLPTGGFDAKNLSLIPLEYSSVFIASILSIVVGLYSLLMLLGLRDLIVMQRKKGTLRNLLILVGCIIAASLSTIPLRPLDSALPTSLFTVLAVLLSIVCSFRFPWLVFLSKREKIYTLIFSFLLFVGLTLFNVLLLHTSAVSRLLLYYSFPLKVFVDLVAMFGNIFFGMAFISTLFHLPTAEAFDRKRSEVASLHNLSRLITQVFDFNELVDSVTAMTLDVCEASSSWLEIIYSGEEVRVERERRHLLPGALMGLPGGGAEGKRYEVQIAGMKNITEEEVEQLIASGEANVRESVMNDLKPVVVDDLSADPRFAHVRNTRLRHGSLVVVPLLSHGGMIGILYATKEAKFGFVKDDVEVISAFADQATIAIENSRLIKKSLERERLLRDMLVAQEMQKKLLPQSVPTRPMLEIDAVSTPAFEVGGDYYDFVELPGDRIGIIVGDVSGKGVPAAFYMSVVKGVFQALGKTCGSPRDFMIKANEALAGTIDKHSFVSLIYGIVDVPSSTLTIARAGHCPLLHLGASGVEYIRPNGMGVGLSGGSIFTGAIEERTIPLGEGDVCVFYTDGITEARAGDEEYGYERLLEVARTSRTSSAPAICRGILDSVKAFAQDPASNDDLTLVVLKWTGSRN